MYIILTHSRLDEDFFRLSSSRLTTLNPYTKGNNLDSVLVYYQYILSSLTSFIRDYRKVYDPELWYNPIRGIQDLYEADQE